MTLRPVRRIDADVAVVGSGFAGALTALVLRQMGQRVALLDRGTHPRFVIGESSTPLAGVLLEELADKYDLPRIRPFSKWGTWQERYPDVACGLKRGFSFFQHREDRAFSDDPTHARQLLVEASPHDGIADTHWYRPDFDHWLVREAESAGVQYEDALEVHAVWFEGDRAVIDGIRRGARVRVDAGFVVDASGPRGCLWRALDLGDAPMPWLPPTQALFTHFEHVARWDTLMSADATPPFPVDDAAAHHVLPGAWIWVLRFNNGLTSAGVAATEPVAHAMKLAEGSPAWQRLLAHYPSIARQFDQARAARAFVHTPRVGHRTAVVCGPSWALLPSAASVIDPLLSTGFPLALLGIGRLAAVLAATRPGPARTAALAAYASDTVEESCAVEQLVAALYCSMTDFPVFKRLGTLYFAAASFTETVRRLGHAERARGFLLHADPVFGPALRECTAQALTLARGPHRASRRQALLDTIARAIEPFDVAGLGVLDRHDWYRVLTEDLHAARRKVGASTAEIDALLARCGFAAGAPTTETPGERPAALM